MSSFFPSFGQEPPKAVIILLLRKTNPRNPNIIDVFRAIKYAEKAGSGFDKIFTDLLSKGKKLPIPIVTETSIIFRVDAEIYSDKLIELSLQYKQMVGKDIDMEKLLVLRMMKKNNPLTLL